MALSVVVEVSRLGRASRLVLAPSHTERETVPEVQVIDVFFRVEKGDMASLLRETSA